MDRLIRLKTLIIMYETKSALCMSIIFPNVLQIGSLSLKGKTFIIKESRLLTLNVLGFVSKCLHFLPFKMQ